MTRAATEERKGIRRFQTILVILLLLVLSAVAARKVLIDEPQKWRQTELDIAVSRFIDSLWLARTEWMRLGKPAEVTLLGENSEQAENITKNITKSIAKNIDKSIAMNEQGWPAVEQGCMRLWQRLGSEVPGNELQAELKNGDCHYRMNQRPWFSYSSQQGRIIHK